MGLCKDCRFFNVEGTILKTRYCTNPSVREAEARKLGKRYSSDVQVWVDENGSCNHFFAASTSESVGYHVDSSKNSGCFLTSACVEYLGKDDDCKELTTLRQFRDTYMKNLPGGEDLIAEYYIVAPKIVEKINESSQQDKYYDYIYQKIMKSISFIESNDNESALREYTNMVNHLRTELNIT